MIDISYSLLQTPTSTMAALTALTAVMRIVGDDVWCAFFPSFNQSINQSINQYCILSFIAAMRRFHIFVGSLKTHLHSVILLPYVVFICWFSRLQLLHVIGGACDSSINTRNLLLMDI